MEIGGLKVHVHDVGVRDLSEAGWDPSIRLPHASLLRRLAGYESEPEETEPVENQEIGKEVLQDFLGVLDALILR